MKQRLAKLFELFQAGRITRATYQRARRREKVRLRKLHTQAARQRRHELAIRRGNRNLARFTARTGLEGTQPGFDPLGRFHYWDFERNPLRLWGVRWWAGP